MAKAIKFANNTYLDTSSSSDDRKSLDTILNNISTKCHRVERHYEGLVVNSSSSYSNYYTFTNTSNIRVGGVFYIYVQWANNNNGNRAIGIRSSNTWLCCDQRPACTNGNTTRHYLSYPLFMRPNETVYIDFWQDSGVSLTVSIIDIKYLVLSTEGTFN